MRKDQEMVEREVAALADLPRGDLAALWLTTYGCPPPSGVRRELLIRSAAWHLQAKRLGGFSPNTRRMLKAAMADAERTFDAKRSKKLMSSDPPTQPSLIKCNARRQLAPGARLIREWNGRHHVVDVIEQGFVFEARVFKSLSSIARQITGAHWSGPRFFGL